MRNGCTGHWPAGIWWSRVRETSVALAAIRASRGYPFTASPTPTPTRRGTGRRVDATLADVITGSHPGRTSPADIVLSNPFGMGVLDVALAAAVRDQAVAAGIGTVLRP